MITDFTIGPWTIYEDNSPIVMARKGDENYDIAIIPADYLPDNEVQANAKLIAAAPDLYNALIKIINNPEDSVNIAMAAIGKVL